MTLSPPPNFHRKGYTTTQRRGGGEAQTFSSFLSLRLPASALRVPSSPQALRRWGSLVRGGSFEVLQELQRAGVLLAFIVGIEDAVEDRTGLVGDACEERHRRAQF